MYLLDTQTLFQLFSRDNTQPVFAWLGETRPGPDDLFLSVVSLGQMGHTIELMPPSERQIWRRLLQEGRREFEDDGGVINVDFAVVDIWQSELRGNLLDPVAGAADLLGEDDRLVLATAIARGFTLVTPHHPVIEALTGHTSLTAVYL
jgi:predicted nucleic acid-binding protein